MPRSLTLAFAGTPQFAVPALDALNSTRHLIRAVFTQADRGAGRGRVLQASPVKQRALQLGLPVHQPATLHSAEAVSLIAGLGIDVLVVVAYGLILPREILAVPPLGCVNIHASLLPRWRGAAPIQRAILAGDATTGVCIMRMEEGLDTGPIIAVREQSITPQDTAQSLAGRLAEQGAALLCETLGRLADGPIEAQPQSAQGVTYAAKIGKSEALIDWHEDALALARKVRAFNPRPVAETRYHGRQLRIWQAEALPAAPGAPPAGTMLAVSRAGMDVACGRGVLRVLELQLPGRKVQGAAQFAQPGAFAGAIFPS